MTNVLIVQNILFFKRKVKFQIPLSYNELNQYSLIKHLHLITYLFVNNEQKFNKILKQTEYERIKLLYSFCNRRILLKLNSFEINELLKYTEWLVNSVKTLNNWIVDYVEIKKNLYFGPNPTFAAMTFREFIFADTTFLAYQKTKNEKLLIKLAAILYRKQEFSPEENSFNGDIREKFNENVIEHKIEQFRKLKPHLLTAIFFNYTTMRKWLTEKYIYVFGNYQKNEDDNSGSNNSETSSWGDVLKNLSPNILDIDKYADQPLHNVLNFIDNEILKDLKK